MFYTNYDSRKGRDLAAHPFAALVLFWEPLHRQLRVEGAIERVTAAESDAYFASRPHGSRLGAVASPQSQAIASRAPLERRSPSARASIRRRCPARPRTGAAIASCPDTIELWQGQPSRLHDRVRYRLVGGAWQRERLAP